MKEVTPRTGGKRDKEREMGGRDGWEGNGFTSVHVRNPWHQCRDAIAAKKSTTIFTRHACMSPPCTIQGGTTGSIQRMKLAGWVWSLLHALQDRKKKRDVA